MRLVYARDNDLIYNGIRFKKPLDIFLTANTKKTFRRMFNYEFGCKESSEQSSYLEFILKNSKQREAGLKHN